MAIQLNQPMNQTHYRTCNLCEAMCGIEVKVENEKIVTIKGDTKDTFSRGHICPKAVALKDIYEDPDRLKTPVKRTPNGWEAISWEEAYTTVVSNIKAIQEKYGHNAVAVYQGNPSIHNLGTTLSSPLFVKTLHTKNIYSATSTDQLPHHFVSWLMFGHPMLLPVPDIDHTDFMLIIGGNPLASNGSMMSVPDVEKRLKAIQNRGGKVVVIDPRKTETAQMASQYLAINPGTDALLLLAMVHTIFKDNLIDLGRLADFTDGIENIALISNDFSPKDVEQQTGISADIIIQLTYDFAKAKKAVCYGRIGVSTQAFGGICQWLIYVLNILTGNLDREGGAMFTKPAFDFISKAKPENRFSRWRSRVRNLPEFMGELPVSTLAEEILTEGEGQIKCLITSCGNPILSTPNGKMLEEAIEKLDFMLAIDIYINETSCHADIILPPATGLEVSHYDVTFHTLAVRNTAKYSEALFEKTSGAKYDYEIYQELAQRLAVFPEKKEIKFSSPEEKLALGLQLGPYQLSLAELKTQPHGIDLGALSACLPERLIHENKRIDVSPPLLLKDIERLKTTFNQASSADFPFLLIGRRHLRDNNSWMHNSGRLVKGKNRCTLLMHPTDVANLELTEQTTVKVSSSVGSVSVPLEISESIKEGVVSLPHGYGHWRKGIRLEVASQHAGVSINDLTDNQLIDELTGNAAFSNVRVKIEKV